ncbi:GvpL/GvpF family gas vesicle protein [Anthocerotibacter panamensis]|uniref:GvpL/GvpF family gas vesicle protein n=1 Tax=Anthocerotibacter panamensis TaxID=2857077 RepID=UPI001C40646C|nr:GvpL/GvpF family gas vesicle protein [Anthocerotibacter panamensis]
MYAFALAPAPAISQAILGIIPEPVVWISVGALVAVVQPLDLSAIMADEAQSLTAVVAHDRVLRELFALGDILPLRFGTVFVSETALKEHLETHQAHYQQKLTHVAGFGEFALKVQPLPPSVPSPTPALEGRAYFTARKAHQNALLVAQQTAQTERLRLPSDLCTCFMLGADRVHVGPERIDFLLPRAQETALIAWVQAQVLIYHQLTLIGPLPPYHFV